MTTSTEITKITGAFLNAQKKIESVIKDSSNPFFKSKYADLTSVIEACKEQLNNEGIAILQPINTDAVETILVHISGEWFSSSTPIVCKEQNNPQAMGSAITYAKRYGLQSMVLLPAEDDDGNVASVSPAKVSKTAETPKVEQSTTSVVSEAKKPTEYTATLNQQRAVASAITHTVGIKDVVEQKKWISEFVKRPIVSLKELTAREASSVLDKYGRDAVAQVDQFKPKAEEVEAKKQEIENAENGTELPF